jgi:hypothetical protein
MDFDLDELDPESIGRITGDEFQRMCDVGLFEDVRIERISACSRKY